MLVSATLRPAMAPITLVLIACALAAPTHAAPSERVAAIHAVREVIAVPDNAETSVKLNEVEPLRAEPDLLHPGAPQHQEHETQNPERHSDEGLKVSGIRESIERTRDLLTQSLRDTSASVQSWLASGDDQTHIQRSIQSLRDTFSTQIQKLNDTIHTLMKPENERKVEAIESKLKTLKDNFDEAIEALSTGLERASKLKTSAEDGQDMPDSSSMSSTDSSSMSSTDSSSMSSTEMPPSSTAPSGSSSAASAMANWFNIFSQSVAASFSNLFSMFQPPPSGTQSDALSQPMTFRPPIIVSSLISSVVQVLSSVESAADEPVTAAPTSEADKPADAEKPTPVEDASPPAAILEASGVNNAPSEPQSAEATNEIIPEEMNETMKDKEVEIKPEQMAEKTE